MSFIGVIDSGVGGLTILRQLQQSHPYNYCYIADHAFCPYGSKSNDVLFHRASKLVKYLRDNGSKAVVLACNTISVYARELSSLYNLPVYDVITPTCQAITSNPNVKRVALLATRSTLNNRVYHNILSQYGVEVADFDCSSFVPFVEQCATSTLACRQTVQNKLYNLPQTRADAVILGCTHFPLLRGQIAYYCGDAKIFECRCDLPDNIFDYSTSPVITYFTTGSVDFANVAAKWCGSVVFMHLDI